MNDLLGQLEKSIEDGNKASFKTVKGGDLFSKDPILEEIKKRMGIHPRKKEPLPVKKKSEFKVQAPPTTQTMFDSRQINDINQMLQDPRNTRGTEIEASFGFFNNDSRGGEGRFFKSGVYSGIYFSNLLSRMFATVSSQERSKMEVEYSNTKVEIKTHFQQGGNYDKRTNVRRIVYLDEDKEEWQYKYKAHKIDNHIWGIRISKSIETFLEPGGKTGKTPPVTLGDVGINPEEWSPSITRHRRRTSFTEASSNGLFYGVRIDLTVVRKIDHSKSNDTEMDGFEVEVEKLDNVSITADKFTEIIERLYRWMFGDYRHSVFIREPVEKLRARPVNWDKNIKLFSDGTFVYMKEKGEKEKGEKRRLVQKAYGKIVPKHIRLLSLEDKQTLELEKLLSKVKSVTQEETKKKMHLSAIKHHSNLPEDLTWDTNLKIITDGTYAYVRDKGIYKIYAIVVGPEELTESDRKELEQAGVIIKDADQANVNKITTKIQELESDVDTESLEVYHLKPGGVKLTYNEEEIIWDPNHIMTLEERQIVIDLHNRLFWYDMDKKHIALAPATGKNAEMCANNYFDKGKRKLQPYKLWSNYWNRPKNIKLKNLLDPKCRWALTLKYDGVRSFLFIHEYGVYMINPPYTLIYMGKGDKGMSGTLLDGEFISDLDKTTNLYTRITFWAFDILFYRGEDYRSKRLIERLSILDSSVKELHENHRNFPYLKKKKFLQKDSLAFFAEHFQEKDTDIYENIRYLLRENKESLRKIETYLNNKEINIPEEMVKVLLKKIEGLLEQNRMPEEEIKEVLTESGLSKSNSKSIFKNIKIALKESNEIAEKTDGLIFQPYIWYCNPYTFKWKPPMQLTIDFYLKRMTKKNVTDLGREFLDGYYYYYTMVGDKKNGMKIFKGDYSHPYIGYIREDSNTINEGGEPIDGRIVECEWRKYEADDEEAGDDDEDDSDFVPLRIRVDRTRPNDERPTAISVWQDINNPITQNTIEGRNIKIMRKYHNEVKMDLLARTFGPGATILDIGSGRGGDIQKWRALGLKKVYAMEPDTGNSIKEFRERLEQDKKNKRKNEIDKDIPFTYPDVTLLNYGSHKTNRIKIQLKEDKTTLDGIVAFFSLTFFPKSEKMYNNLLNTIDLLPVGGKFIGIVLSGEEVKTLLDQSNSVFIKDYIGNSFLLKGYDSENQDLEELNGTWEDGIESWVFNDEEKDGVKEYIKNHKAYISEAFTIKQQGPFFSQKDKDEKEIDGISNSIIGDEIMIDLRGIGDDQTTMVQSQTEWLFNFNYFKKRLKEKFKLVESRSLSYTVTSSGRESFTFVYKNLPKDSQVFSSLNEVFVFEKRGLTKEDLEAAEVLSPLEPNDLSPIKLKLNNIEYSSIQRVGVIQSSTSFIHSVLLAVNKKYQKKSIDERESQVSKVRKILANDLTPETFQTLHGGTISAKLEEKAKSDIDKRPRSKEKDIKRKSIEEKKKEIEEKAFEYFKKALEDIPEKSTGSGSWMGELEMTELLSHRYKVNIYVVSVTGILGDVVLVKSSTLFSNYCDSLYNYDNSIVLLRQRGMDYVLLKPLGVDRKTNTFDETNKFVQQLHQEICG